MVGDIGGATTDVYSVVTPVGEDASLAKDVVAMLWRARTVEGDLGMRWGAPGVMSAAEAEGLGRSQPAASLEALSRHARRVHADVGWLPVTGADWRLDGELAATAALVAARRHGRAETATASPRPLRDVGLVVGSGGVLRHGDNALRRAVLGPLTTDHGGGWRAPEGAGLAVDSRYVLFAAGLLADQAPVAAARLATTCLTPVP
jgi:uncharacterized protein (TIGR01319 family)